MHDPARTSSPNAPNPCSAAARSVRIASDQPGPAPVRGEADQPPDEDQYAVLEPDEVEEVDRQPDEPRGEAAEPDPLDVGHRAGAADGRQVALVAVAKRLDRPAA